MRSFNFVTLASAALVALRVKADEPNGTTITYNGTSVAVDCLTPFNDARTAAGLAPFVSAEGEFRITFEDDEDKKNQTEFNNNVCEALLTHKQIKNPVANFNRTIALAIQDGDTADCAAAVTHFNGALSLFGSLPPVFTEKEEVYKKLQAVSFVALYNPKDAPKLDCGYFTCTETTTTQKKEEPPKENNTPTERKITGLLCATAPQALINGQAPFSQEQYDKITSAINSASAAVPAFITLAVTAVGLALF